MLPSSCYNEGNFSHIWMFFRDLPNAKLTQQLQLMKSIDCTSQTGGTLQLALSWFYLLVVHCLQVQPVKVTVKQVPSVVRIPALSKAEAYFRAQK